MELPEIAKLFNAHNRSRIERLVELAPKQQQSFLELLPLIFQSNDPALPCYVEGAPFGIVDYQPSDALLSFAKKYQPTLAYTKKTFDKYPIQGLYLINDLGALDYPSEPNFDLWLIYSSNNSDEQTQLLKTKLHDVIKFAKSLGIKLNARLLNDTAVTEHKIETDDLDRLYSSGLILAGCLPLWWLISPIQEQDYATHARQIMADHSKELSLLDFGPLTNRSPSVATDSAIKASLLTIENGLLGYLELFYQQSLLANFSNNLWLSTRYKQRIYNNETNPFFCDPLLLKFELLSEKLSPQSAHLLRRSLYLICNERLSTTVKSPRHPWRREGILDLVNQWQWEAKELRELDHRNQAVIRLRLSEFNLTKTLIKTLNDSIAVFAKKHAPDAAKNVVKLQKAYQTTFDSPAGVIPCLPAVFIPETSEDTLFIEYEAATQQWHINEIERATLKKGEVFSPLHSNASLPPIIAWAIINGALSKFTRIKLVPNTSNIASTAVYGLVEYLVQSPLAVKSPSDTNLNWLMIANCEKTPEEAYKHQDMKLALRLRDPLNYGYHRRNMILNLGVLASPDNKEWHYLSHDGDSATAEILAGLLRWQTDSSHNSHIDCWCPTPQFASSIMKRLAATAKDMSLHFQTHSEYGIYLLEVGGKISRIHWQKKKVDATHYSGRYDLNTVLSLTRPHFAATRVDDNLDVDGLYSLLLKAQDTKQIRVFIDTQKSQSNVYVLDELGHLDKLKPTGLKESTLLTNLNQFLSAVATSKSANKPLFYKLPHINGEWSLKALALAQAADTNANYLPVQITMDTAKIDSECSIVCGPKTFSGKANDPALFQQVSQFIFNIRKSANPFPLYITELEFKQNTRTATTHEHIVFKQHLESLLNARSAPSP
jgi:adenylate cyclase class 1